MGSGGASCTQEVSKKTFQLAIGEEQSRLEIEATLIDTMGFPDPDPEKAAKHYDSVIECCNEQLNAIVWLVKSERELHSLVEQYKVLLREFNNAKPPIIMIVNGLENYEDDEERQERKAHDIEQSTRFGEAIAEAAGVSVLKTIAGAEKADLKRNCQNLIISLQGIPRKSSKMKTFTQLEMEIESHMDQETNANKEMEKRQEALTKKKQNIVDLKSHINTLKEQQRSVKEYILGTAPTEEMIAAAENNLQKLEDELIEEKTKHAQASSRRHHLNEAWQKTVEAFDNLKQALQWRSKL